MNESQLDLKNTTPIKGFNEGELFGQAFLVRKVSKFLTGRDEDALIPIPVFYDLDSRHILLDSLPKELREEYKHLAL